MVEEEDESRLEEGEEGDELVDEEEDIHLLVYERPVSCALQIEPGAWPSWYSACSRHVSGCVSGELADVQEEPHPEELGADRHELHHDELAYGTPRATTTYAWLTERRAARRTRAELGRHHESHTKREPLTNLLSHRAAG